MTNNINYLRLAFIFVIGLTFITSTPNISAQNDDSIGDVRYWRTGEGVEVSMSTQIRRNAFFSISVKPGNSVVRRVFFITQGGYWNPQFPSDYVAQDLTISSSDYSLLHDYVGVFDYHRWEVQNLPTGEFIINAKSRKVGRALLDVEISRQDGVIEMKEFILDFH